MGRLGAVAGRRWRVLGASATSGAGLREGLEWLGECVGASRSRG